MDTPAPRCKRVSVYDPRLFTNQDALPPPSRASPNAAPVCAIRKYFFLDGHRTSAKAVRVLLGESEYQRAVAAARVAFYADPGAVYTVDTPGGQIHIVFRSV